MILRFCFLITAMCALAQAQTTWHYNLQNSGAICSLPGGSSIPTVGCLPPEFWKAGVWVTIHSDDPKVFGFNVVVSVVLADGSTATQEQFVKRAVGGNTDGCANVLMWFGKVPSDFTLPPTKISVMDVPFGHSADQALPVENMEYLAGL